MKVNIVVVRLRLRHALRRRRPHDMTLTLSSTLWLAASLRLLLLVWGILQDARGGDIGYTDIDYQVFTDAARCLVQPDHLLCAHSQGASAPKWLGDPYARATYRYTPLLAVVTAPNIAFASFGKAMFAAADLLIGSLLYDILLDSGLPSVQAVRWTWLWLLNPIVAVVSTRGNAEALVGLAVISSLRQLVRRRNVSSAFFLGVAIHLKLYPIIYGASVLAFLSPRDRRFALCRAQIVYASVVAGTLLSLSWFMYELYVSRWQLIDTRAQRHSTAGVNLSSSIRYCTTSSGPTIGTISHLSTTLSTCWPIKELAD